MLQLCIVYRFVLVLLLSVLTMAEDRVPFCPPGFARNETGSCICWKHHLQGILQCDEETGVAKIANGYCMTFDGRLNTTIVGKCPFQNISPFKYNAELVYTILPDSLYDLETQQCGGHHRRGALCCKCEDHYGPSMTLSMDCVPCGNVFGHYGRFVYVLSQFVFATVLYLLIVLFNVRLTKSPINCFLLFAQVIVNMLNYDAALYAHLQYAVSKSSFFEYSAKLVISFYGFLNLDLFPVILPPFCISSSLKGTHLFLLEYVVALYPLLLTALIYFLVSLYTRDVKPVVLVWRAVKYCLKPKLCCGVRWFLNKISTQGLANSFASFLLLSYSKIIFVSVSFLLPINLYTVGLNATIPETVLYYDPSVQFFGPRHWPYAILLLSIFCLFVVLPLLLLFLYPLCVHSCVCVKYSSHSIRFFVENFQGWFKDRTEEGTRDFRLVSCVNPLLRIIFGLSIMLVYVFVHPASGFFSAQWFIPGFVFVATSLLFSIARPYKLEYMNSLETLLYSLLGVISFLSSHRLGIYVVFLLCPIPMMVLIGYVVYLALKRLKVCCYIYVLNRCGNSETARLLTEGAVEQSLPHRLENPELYNTRPTGPQSMKSVPPLPKKHTKDSYGAIVESD